MNFDFFSLVSLAQCLFIKVMNEPEAKVLRLQLFFLYRIFLIFKEIMFYEKFDQSYFILYENFKHDIIKCGILDFRFIVVTTKLISMTPNEKCFSLLIKLS